MGHNRVRTVTWHKPAGAAGARGAVLALAAILAGVAACGEPRPVAERPAGSPSAVAATTASPSARPALSPRPTATPRPAPAPSSPAPHPAVAAGWVGPVYPPHLHGYDVSYP